MILAILASFNAWSAPMEHAQVLAHLGSSLSDQVDQLTLPEAPPVYFARAHLSVLESAELTASFGAIVGSDHQLANSIGVELRVGDYSFDQSGLGGWQNGFGSSRLPAELQPYAIELNLWRTIDRAYKESVEQYARKQAQVEPAPDHPGDYQELPPQLVLFPTLSSNSLPTESELQSFARELSSAFTVDPAFEVAQVHMGSESGWHYIVDTDGSQVVRARSELSVRAFARVRADDGTLISDGRYWTFRATETAPDVHEMTSEVTQMQENLRHVAETQRFSEEYIGPVLFRGVAAHAIFRYLLAPQLEGTPPETPFETWFGELGSTASNARTNRRVLPDGWGVANDPMDNPEHPAAFAHDFEGTAASSTKLVQDGIATQLLMSRVPRKELKLSNGSARGHLGGRPLARVSQWTVSPPRPLSDRKLHKVALRTASKYGSQCYITVDRLQEPAVINFESFDTMYMGDDIETGASLPPPVSVFRVCADGTQTELRNVSFANVSRWLLRDIQAAGQSTTSSYLVSTSGTDPSMLRPIGGLPVEVTAPSILVGELELLPVPGDPKSKPVLSLSQR